MGAPDPADVAHMRAALALARRCLGVTWPNPSVGCVIVRDGRVVGRASTAPGGRPHAETAALAHAGGSARGATAYVTLEPCCHWGRTPPCTGALVDAGVARVVLGVRDPDSRVDGQGIAALRARGIEVVEGVLEDEAAAVIAAFGQRVRAGRPLVTLKLASTLDGRIATRAGESRWITGPAARRAAHALRGCHDAVMVGIGTALADDPDLTCRIPGMRALPVVRVVADSALRTPFSSRLVASASEAPVWLLVSPDADPAKRAEAERLGARVIAVHPHPDPLPQAGEGEVSLSPVLGEEGGHTLNLRAALLALGAAGLTSVLAEGGARLAAGLLQADLVDRLAWFHAPAVIGGDGLPAASAMGLERLADLPRFRRHSATPLGGDMLTTFERAP